jgi:hypothetical protein
MPRKEHLYHYIYKTTCKVTGRYYVGMHSTSNLEDDYIGSGKRLWYSIKKYGKENHMREILEFLPDRKTLVAREKQIVNQELLLDSNCMNLIEGGIDHDYQSLSENVKEKISRANKGRKLSPEHRKKLSEAGKNRKFSEECRNKMSEKAKGRKKTEKHRENISNSTKGSSKPDSFKEKLKLLYKGKKRDKITKKWILEN